MRATSPSKKAKNLLLTGAPGVGKTSLLLKAVAQAGLRAGGFFTQEIREKGKRVGFSLTTFDGTHTTLAHTQISSPHKVGKYSVSLENLERVGVQALLWATDEAQLIVVDEIGRMELFSRRFQDAVLAALEGEKRVLGTIMRAAHPFADMVKAGQDTAVLHLTLANRQETFEAVAKWLAEQPESTVGTTE